VKARNWWLTAVAVVVVVGAGGWFAVKHSALGHRAEIGTGYAAHVVCSCRYVGNRDMKSCATDFEPGMEIVKVSDDTDTKRITAWVPLLAKRTATYSPEFGCALDPR